MKHSVWNRFVSFALALVLAAGPAVSGAQAAHAEQAAQERSHHLLPGEHHAKYRDLLLCHRQNAAQKLYD